MDASGLEAEINSGLHDSLALYTEEGHQVLHNRSISFTTHTVYHAYIEIYPHVTHCNHIII